VIEVSGLSLSTVVSGLVSCSSHRCYTRFMVHGCQLCLVWVVRIDVQARWAREVLLVAGVRVAFEFV